MDRSNSPRERRDERGFTLVELMVVVVIVAVLAAIVVPTFMSEAKKVKASSEVNAMLAELSAKQERYKNEFFAYLDLPACPTAPNHLGQDVLTACMANVTDPWVVVGVQPPETKLRCNYEVTVGTSADTPVAPSGATFSIPAGCCATAWYIVHAKCDMDGNGTYSHYVMASFDQRIQVTNEGQ